MYAAAKEAGADGVLGMAISINSNISALRAVRRLFESTASVGTAFERLSSGQRINRASDDPAGLAVSVSLGAKGRVFQRGYLNAVDGLSALSIADSAIGQLSTIYQRMAELAEQSANGTLGASQRLNLSREYSQLDKELRRIVGSTTFNGRELLKGEKVNRSSVNLGLDSGIGQFFYLGTSGDGRYSLVAANELGTYTMAIHDRISGTNSVVAVSPTISVGSMSQNGDIVYGDTSTDQIYLRKLSGETIQLTNGSAGTETFSGMSLSADGRYLAFTSRNIYADGGSIDNPIGTKANESIYRLDIETGAIRAYSPDVAVSAGFELSNDGSKLIFRSTTNILSQGDGGAEFYGIDFSQSTLAPVQISNGTGSVATGRIDISDSGDAYFVDSRDLAGQNSSLVNQIWKYSLSSSALTTLTQNSIATTIVGVTLSNDGSMLHFISDDNYSGENPLSRMQAQRFDFSTGERTQLTKYTNQTLNLTSTALFSGDGRFVLGTRSATINASLTDLSEGNTSLDIEVGLGTSGGIAAIYQGIRGILSGLGNYTLTSQQSSLAALDQAKANIEQLAQLRGKLGSSSSRLTSAAALLQSQVLEITSAQGRIKDADVAQESAELTRSTILQQVGAAVLAQANAQPRIALSLLAGI